MWHFINFQVDADDPDGQKIDNRKMDKAVNFKTLYETLPHRLSAKMTENLSGPLAFVGLLHLANEKCLRLGGVDDHSDVIINQGP